MAKKLSVPMEDMIKGAALHSIRVDGIVIKAGLIVAGRPGTLVALIDRDLVTTSDAGNYGMNWLTDEGLKVYAELTGGTYMPREVPGFPVPDTMTHVVTDPTVTVADVLPVQHREMEAWLREHPVSEDHPTESDMITDVERQAHAEAEVNDSKRRAVEAWLLNYAWMGTDEQKAATVACIMAQDDWQSVDWVAERFESAQSGDDTQERITGNEFALSALYECHEGPHIDGCADNVLPFDDSACEPEVTEQMRADATDCDDCKGDHDTIVACRIHRDPVAYTEHIDSLILELSPMTDQYADYSTNELPGDAERAWDAENAAMEAASIRAEYEGEFDDDDDVMVKTPRTFVSMNYLNTMRRIHADRAISRDKWKDRQYGVIADRVNLFALIDSTHAAGKISFGMADREKRKIRNITRPTLGCKHKPSKSRRNRH